MKKVVIAGNAKLQPKINEWIDFFTKNDYQILDYPRPIEENKFMELFPEVHTDFFKNIAATDMLFIMNEDKDGIIGYIGAEVFAELSFGLAQKLVYNRNIDLVILKMPSKEVQCYDDIELWLKLNWIKLFKEEK